MPPDEKTLSRSVGGLIPLSKLATGGVKTQECDSRHPSPARGQPGGSVLISQRGSPRGPGNTAALLPQSPGLGLLPPARQGTF